MYIGQHITSYDAYVRTNVRSQSTRCTKNNDLPGAPGIKIEFGQYHHRASNIYFVIKEEWSSLYYLRIQQQAMCTFMDVSTSQHHRGT